MIGQWNGEILLRLIAIAQGKGANADIKALDDSLLEEDVRRFAGPMTGMVMKAVAHRKGPERILDWGCVLALTATTLG